MLRSTKKSRRHRNPKSSDEKKGVFFSKNIDENPSPKVQQPFFQTKLHLSQPNDKYEREADAVADRVTNSNTNRNGSPNLEKISRVQPGSLKPAQMKLQRKAELESTSLQMQEMEEEEPVQMMEEEEETMQMQQDEEEGVQMQEEEEAVQMQEEEEEVQMMEGEEDEEVQMQEEEEEEPVQMAELEEEEAVQTQNEGVRGAPSPTLSNRIREKAGRGRSLPGKAKAEMESAFGVDLSEVNIHTDTEAVRMNKELGAEAFTHGKDVYFNSGKYQPESTKGQHLLAHELTHVVQQNPSYVDTIQRSCLPAAECPTVVPGSAAGFGAAEEAAEVSPRARRKRMTCARATSSGHAGHARQLERILIASDPTAFSQIQGVFLDADMSRGTGAMVTNCTDWADFALPISCDPPSISNAARPCVLVHGNLNREAYLYNNTSAPNIGGLPREDWRIQTVQTLIHEAQHVLFDEASRPEPPGVHASCPRNSIHHELSELNAILSEFPTVFRAIPASGPGRTRAIERLNAWFHYAITNPYESIAGTLKAARCVCDCSDINSHVRDVFDFVSTGWTANEKTEFHTELRKARWNADPINLNWPL